MGGQPTLFSKAVSDVARVDRAAMAVVRRYVLSFPAESRSVCFHVCLPACSLLSCGAPVFFLLLDENLGM